MNSTDTTDSPIIGHQSVTGDRAPQTNLEDNATAPNRASGEVSASRNTSSSCSKAMGGSTGDQNGENNVAWSAGGNSQVSESSSSSSSSSSTGVSQRGG